MRSLIVANMILWVTVASPGGEEQSEARVVGPLKVNRPGTLLLCGTKAKSTVRYYNVLLDGADDKARVLQVPGVDSCLGAEWRHSAESNELWWTTGDEQQELRAFKITADGISRIESIPIDPNLLVGMASYGCGDSGNIILLRVVRYYASSGAHLGFLTIDDGILHESTISAPGELLRTDESTFYMIHGVQESRPMQVMSKAKLNPQTMALEVTEVLKAKEIRLAAQPLDGAVVYVVGAQVFCGDRPLCVLPEKLSPGGRLYVDGSYLAYFSDSGTTYVLDRTGQIIRTKRIKGATSVFGLSALTHCIYGVREDVREVYAYDFAGDVVKTLFSVERGY